jgi:pimeloyl-ACP methyl ester carboxylesterase
MSDCGCDGAISRVGSEGGSRGDGEGISRAELFERGAAGAAVVAAGGALAAPPAHARAQEAEHGRRYGHPRPPLVLQAQGSFFVGGTIEFRDPNSTTPDDPRFLPGDIAVNQMYVEYQIPQHTKYRYPIVLMHGGGHTGKTFETTPDGREGWFTTFTRRGFSPYKVDAPNRGRTGYDPTHRYKVYLGLEPPTALEIGNIYSAQAAWVAFRWGPAYGIEYPGQQFPVNHLRDYLPQSVPSYRDSTQNPKIVADLVALIDKLGPCILLGWSTGTSNVMNAAVQRPTLVKGVIGLEGAPPTGGVDMITLAKIPVVVLIGDNTSPANADAFTDSLVSLGGDAATIWLPDVGLHGNGHTMMMERNSEQVAEVVVRWINTHVPNVRGRYHPREAG